ncbi:P-II family nitrogen regulator [Oceanospirillum sanctuarii]|uniref:P-II family nitrogen regulator n=1 Tax=Oceanospirillum sanctuarii TaxID=1434821 RepID=UPI000A386658|nr:transcriptional regulator [Oceanospirillum sanctuarii]
MKFSALVAIVPEDMEQSAIDTAKELGAGGITVLNGRGISNEAKKTFFGLSYDGSQTVLLMVLEKSLALQILKAIKALVAPDSSGSKGLVFIVPLEHLGGIDANQFEKFEAHLKDAL